MKRRWVILLLICLPGIAGQSPAARKPTLFVVHDAACPPCRTFDRVWCDNRAVREALQDAFDVRELDWARPAEQSDAIGLGATRLPSFVVVRGTRRLAMSVGFTTSRDNAVIDEAIAKLMCDLFVEWPRVRTDISGQQPRLQAPTPQKELPRVNPAPVITQPEQIREATPELPRVNPDPGPTVDQTARDGVTKLITQSRELQDAQQQTQSAVAGLQSDVAAVKSQVSESREQISQQLQQSHESTRSEISTITDRLRETIERTRESLPPLRESIPPIRESPRDILTEIPKAGVGVAASSDGSLLGGIAKVGIGAAALYFGLPAGVGVAAFGVVSWLVRRRRKGAGHRPGTFPGVTGSTDAAASATKGHTDGKPLPREYTEAVELLQLAEREGRIPIHEAIRGTLADDEIDRLSESIDPATRQVGLELRDRIARRFNTVAPISQDPSKYQE